MATRSKPTKLVLNLNKAARCHQSDYRIDHLRTFFDILVQIQEKQRQFPQRFARRLHQVGKRGPFSLPDEASGRNVVEIVFVLPVFVLKCLNSHHPMSFVNFLAKPIDLCFSLCLDVAKDSSDELLASSLAYRFSRGSTTHFC